MKHCREPERNGLFPGVTGRGVCDEYGTGAVKVDRPPGLAVYTVRRADPDSVKPTGDSLAPASNTSLASQPVAFRRTLGCRHGKYESFAELGGL